MWENIQYKTYRVIRNVIGTVSYHYTDNTSEISSTSSEDHIGLADMPSDNVHGVATTVIAAKVQMAVLVSELMRVQPGS